MRTILAAILAVAFALPAHAQLPNGGFESWIDAEGDTVAEGWQGYRFGSGRTDNAHSGQYAAGVWNWYYYSKGMLITGKGNVSQFNLNMTGVPIATKPTRISGYYRFVPGDTQSDNDSAVVTVFLRRYNPAAERQDTIVWVRHLLGPAATYTPFAIDLPDRMPGVQPDTVVVALISSDSGFCNPGSDGNCCYFHVDDIAFTGPSGVAEPAAWLFNGVRTAPNPAREFVNLMWQRSPVGLQWINLYSADGRLQRTVRDVTGTSARIDCGDLAAGQYTFEVRSSAGSVAVGRFIVH